MAAFKAKRLSQEQVGFWVLKPNKGEEKHLKGAIFLGNALERWVIPDVSLMDIEDVFYSHFAQDVREANPGNFNDGLNDAKVFQLWGALVKKAFDFAPKQVQTAKLMEVSSDPRTSTAHTLLTLLYRHSLCTLPLLKRVWMNFLVCRGRTRKQPPQKIL